MGEEKAAQCEVDERRVRRRRGNTLARWEVVSCFDSDLW